MPDPAPPKPGGPATRESTPLGGTRHATNQLAKTAAASTVALLEELYTKSLVPTGGECTVENLANALLLLMKQKEAKNASLQTSLKAIALLLKVATDPLERLQAALETAVESRVGTAVHQLEENVAKLTAELVGLKAEYSKSSSVQAGKVVVVWGGVDPSLGEVSGGAEGADSGMALGDPAKGGLGRSYAGATSGRMERPAQVVTSRIDKQDRQILLDCESMEVEGVELGELPESSLVLKAQLVMEILGAELTADMPEGAKFRSANVLQNGGVVYEMNSKEAADWIKRPDICAAFVDNFGPTVTLKERSFPVVVECVPIAFDTAMKNTFDKFEHENNLPAHSISSGRYIRPPARRPQGQRHAHVVLQFRSKDAANLCIKSPMIAEGKQCDARKLAKKPVRCTKCQKYGHSRKKCKSSGIECGTCPGQHDTSVCNDRNNHFCKTCKAPGHPTWDTKCPGYYSECVSFATRVPDNLYTYYLTSEEWTWEKVTDAKQSITTPPPFQPTAQAFSQPPPPRAPRAPRKPQPPPFGRNAVAPANNTTTPGVIVITTAPTLTEGSSPSTVTAVAPAADDSGRWTPSAPHPRPENVASPSVGGSVHLPKVVRGGTRGRGSLSRVSPAPSQSRLTPFLKPRSDSVSSAASTVESPVVLHV